jgi:cytochrome b6-f complex iron-sulfur subunit
MERKDFLKLVGISVAGITLARCVSACSKVGGTAVDFTLDLSQAANAALNTNGGYLYSNGVIVARTLAGAYIAVSSSCTHEGGTVAYDGANSRFRCPLHGATFGNTGSVISGPTSTPLTQYTVTQSGTVLHIKS